MRNEYKTKSRNAIIEYMRGKEDTRFTARDILNAVNAAGCDLDRSTVYRNLERLCLEGKLVKYKETDINAACYAMICCPEDAKFIAFVAESE